MTPTLIQKPCADCGKPFEAQSFTILGVTISGDRCPDCDTAREQAWEDHKACLAKLERPADPAARFREIATESGFGRFLAYNPEKSARAVIRNFNAGMMFIGPSGTGKTFLAVEIMRQKHAEGKTVALVDALMLGIEVSNLSSERREAALDAALEPDWLLIDDFGKGKITERVAEAFFLIVNRRENFSRPILWTTNATAGQIRERLPVEYADPFLERLARTSQTVSFRL